MQEAVLENLPKNLYEEKKQARMCNKLRLSTNKHKSVHGLHTFYFKQEF